MDQILLKKKVGVGDMVLLSKISEEGILANVQERFKNGDIYTFIGPVVISINPYSSLKIYTTPIMDMYYGRNQFELPPHIYALAEAAYKSLTSYHKDQCIMISGESGSGKTEASKVIMQYVAHVCGRGDQVNKIKDMLLKCNPVLEAFGNAKTVRNDNSSRFGKYMDIQFDFKGDPIGGVIYEYLLEKSRVVFQNTDERNFHIFYQLLRGAEVPMLEKLKLTDQPAHYLFLNQSGCDTIDTMDDVFGWEETIEALGVIGFSEKQQSDMWSLISVILHMSNLDFADRAQAHGNVGSKMTVGCSELCELLGVTADQIEDALCRRTVKTGRESVETSVNAAGAVSAVRAMSSAIFQRLFTWLVLETNKNIAVQGAAKGRKSLGVLDIYGFEIFDENNFEQFIINYCNEKLQQAFIELTLKSEQEEYVREGIEWTEIKYFNNSIICDLIEGKAGILRLIDDHCLRSSDASDEQLLDSMNHHAPIFNHAHYESRASKNSLSDRSIKHDAFRLLHYAGTVTYEVEGFIRKSKDSLWGDITKFLYSTQNELLRDLFAKDGGADSGPPRRPTTLGSQFKISMKQLMENLKTKEPHYIRCIKPNSKKKPKTFDSDLVMHQIKYLGLLENVRVRRSGFAFRMNYELFVDRYKMLSSITWPVWKGSPREGTQYILRAMEFAEGTYANGRSKIFIKDPTSLFKLEEKRRIRSEELATKIAATWRMSKQRKIFTEIRNASNLIAAWVKGRKQRKLYLEKRAGILLVTSFYRMWRERRKFEEQEAKIIRGKASVIMAAWVRGFLVRRDNKKRFKRHLGPTAVKPFAAFQKRGWLRETADLIESGGISMVPNDKIKVPAPPVAQTIAAGIKNFLHEWRCKAYRDRTSIQQQKILREKHIASQLFKGKKASYPASVAKPFKGDVIGLDSEEIRAKWEKGVVQLTGMGGSEDILVALQVDKINRSDGKPAERIFALTSQGLIITDIKYRLKYRILFEDISGLSASSHGDNVFVVHVVLSTSKGTKKGDHMFVSDSLIEIMTRMYTAYLKQTGNPLKIQLQDEIDLQLAMKEGRLNFQPNTEVEDGLAVTRRKTMLTVNVPPPLIVESGSAGKRARGGSIRKPNAQIMNDINSGNRVVGFRASTGGLISRGNSTSSLPSEDSPGKVTPPKRSQSTSEQGTTGKKRTAKASVPSPQPILEEESRENIDPEQRLSPGSPTSVGSKSAGSSPNLSDSKRGRGGRSGRGRGRGRGSGRGRGAPAEAPATVSISDEKSTNPPSAATAPSSATKSIEPSAAPSRGRGRGRSGRGRSGRGRGTTSTGDGTGSATEPAPAAGAAMAGSAVGRGRSGRGRGRGRRGGGRGRSGRGRAGTTLPQPSTMSV